MFDIFAWKLSISFWVSMRYTSKYTLYSEKTLVTQIYDEDITMNFINISWVNDIHTWWRHQMETFSALLAICAGNSPAPGEFPAQRPVTRSFGVFFDLRLNKRLSKQSWGWWFETLSGSLWRHYDVTLTYDTPCVDEFRKWNSPGMYFILS